MTALLLTAEEFTGELGESFEAACAAVGVKPVARGYGLVLAQDEHGGRWTQVTEDAQGVDSAQSIPGESLLRPPQRGMPGRRRGMADIDAELVDMRGRSVEEYSEACRWDACNMGDTDPGPAPPRLIDMRGRIPSNHPAHQAVERALAAAWSLAATTRPPPGSARVRKASPGKARLVRATGDGWTLIGGTDGPVILLADTIPGLP